jgi:uncharacterized protein (DUF427 family)
MKPKESVWDYPRPPALEPFSGLIRVVVKGITIASTRGAMRVLETSHPPTYYIPAQDVRMDYLVPAEGHTVCEWKGMADYFDVVVDGARVRSAAWSYPRPKRGFEPIRGHLAFYAHKADACYVDQEKVDPQDGGFYGGWITGNIEGPFKGQRGTEGW